MPARLRKPLNLTRASVSFVMLLLVLVWAMPVYGQEEEVPVEEMPVEEAPTVEVIIVEVPVPVEEPAPTTIIAIDSPSEGAQVRNGERLTISGWATDPSGSNTGVSVVYVYLDAPADQGGTRVDEADYGKSRPDVARAWGRSDWTNSGFELSWLVNGVSTGSHTLYVYALSAAFNEATYQTVSFTVLPGPAIAQPAAPAAPAAAPPAANNAVLRIISPTASQTLTGTTTFTVVAVDCASGTPARSVKIARGSEAGTQLATASNGTARDLSTVCPGRTGSANIEFQLSVNTSGMTSGVQTFTAVAEVGSSTVTQSVSPEVSNTTGGGGTGFQPYNQYSNCSSNPYAAGCSGSGTGTYLYNTPCTTSGTYNCNPNYPNNYGCVSGGAYPCSTSAYGGGTGTYLYNTPCTTTGTYNCNPNYPNNYGCVVGGAYPCTTSSYGTGSGTYLYNTPCSTSGNYNCNPNYPNNYGCVTGGYYPCSNNTSSGTGTYLYNTPCSSIGNYNCNPNYPNNYGCQVGGAYPCSTSSYGSGTGTYLYNTPCSSIGNYNCNPNYPNNYGCVVGGAYPCSNTSTGGGTYLYNQQCTGLTGNNCNPNYPYNYGCQVGGAYPCTGSTTGSGTYLYNQQCTAFTGTNCNPNYPNNFGCQVGGAYQCSGSSGSRPYVYNVQCTAFTGNNCNPNYPTNFGCIPGSIYLCA